MDIFFRELNKVLKEKGVDIELDTDTLIKLIINLFLVDSIIDDIKLIIDKLEIQKAKENSKNS